MDTNLNIHKKMKHAHSSNYGIEMSIFTVTKTKCILICFLNVPLAEHHSHQPFIYITMSFPVIYMVATIMALLLQVLPLMCLLSM